MILKLINLDFKHNAHAHPAQQPEHRPNQTRRPQEGLAIQQSKA
jgi:hypothetical protein